MKTTNLLLLLALLLFTACDHEVAMKTRVSEDGSITKKITLKNKDKNSETTNYFGISEDSGWTITREPSVSEKNQDKIDLSFEKEFSSVEEFNQELNTTADTLFAIEATFSRQFRWFYTYIHFSETYKAIDRFEHVSQEDYFTQEDFAFIERMPAEGAPVSKADSLYADLLNKKIVDTYAMRGIFEDHIHFLEERIDASDPDPGWKKTLSENKEFLLEYLLEKDDAEEDILLYLLDSLGIPLPYPQIEEDYAKEINRLDKELNFMSWAADGTIVHEIEMPWTVTETNADSLAGNILTWKPVKMKYFLQDYTLHATSRKMNIWAVGLSVLLLLAGGYFFFRKP